MFVVLIITSWCSKKINQNVIFEDYYITLETKYHYQEIKNTENNSTKQLIQTNTTWFSSSIIISKNDILQNVEIKTFWDKNKESLIKKINWSKNKSDKKISFTCNNQKINWILQTFIIKENKNKQYLNQVFFIKESKIYWISTMTEDRKESKNLISSIKKINCTTTK
jgi:hypothetical protein